MDTALFDYPLPEGAIAQTPADPRDSSRLLVVERSSGLVSHHIFHALPSLLPPGTRLFRNDAAVLKARLRLRLPSGGAAECLLLNPDLQADPAGLTWWCLLKPGRKLPVGASFGEPGVFCATVLKKDPDGQCLARFDIPGHTSVTDLADRLGEPPLPPYIHRADHSAAQQARDAASYQTVYADPAKKIAAAAPTAGLHFTPAVLAALAARGFSAYDLALRVGLDTFRPIAAAHLEDHVIHREWYEIPPATRDALSSPGGPRLAVGTTSLRALEDYFAKTTADASGSPLASAPKFETPNPFLPTRHPFHPRQTPAPGTRSSPISTPWLSEASLFIYPPRSFSGADLLLTNFHLPRSTLLCLVSAFLTPGSMDGIAWLKEIYADALSRGYRFFSYGDAMLII